MCFQKLPKLTVCSLMQREMLVCLGVYCKHQDQGKGWQVGYGWCCSAHGRSPLAQLHRQVSNQCPRKCFAPLSTAILLPWDCACLEVSCNHFFLICLCMYQDQLVGRGHSLLKSNFSLSSVLETRRHGSAISMWMMIGHMLLCKIHSITQPIHFLDMQ